MSRMSKTRRMARLTVKPPHVGTQPSNGIEGTSSNSGELQSEEFSFKTSGYNLSPSVLGPAVLPPMSPLVVNGVNIGAAPVSVGIISPEPIPIPADEDMLLHPQTISTDVYIRNLMRLPKYHPDALIMGKGYVDLDDLKTMYAYNSSLRLLKYSACAKAWETLPRVNGVAVKPDHPRYDKANEIADFCRYALNNIRSEKTGRWQDPREMMWYVLDMVHSGNSTQEVIWRVERKGEYAGKRVFAQFVPRVPQQITYNCDPFTNEVVSINNYVGYWQSFMPVFKKYLMGTFQPERGLPYGRGVARACYKHVLSINELIRMFGVALERFGSGFLKGEITDGREEKVREFRDVLDIVRLGGSLVITPDKKVDLLQMSGGALDPFIAALNFHAEAISKEILGQSLTTGTGDQGGRSYSLGQVHHGTEEYYKGYVRRDLEMIIQNQLYYWLVITNYGEEYLDCVPAHWMGVWDAEEIGLLTEYFTSLAKVGFLHPQFDDDVLRKRTNMPLLSTTAEEWLIQNPDLEPGQERITVNKGPKPTVSTG